MSSVDSKKYIKRVWSSKPSIDMIARYNEQPKKRRRNFNQHLITSVQNDKSPDNVIVVEP